MSRCFPYPPPGYERNGSRDEALIESIKLRREGEKAKKERRKEKKREKKEKEKAGKNGEIESKKHSHKRRHKDKRSQEEQKGGDHQKRRENETEQFEKSSLTEEHGHPVGSQNLCDSSDSTLNSDKRQKHSSPFDGRHNPGSIFRIRLPLQRHKDPEVQLPSKGQPCSASGRTDAFVQGKYDPASRPARECREHPSSTSEITGKEQEPCLSSRASENFAHKAEIAPPSSLYGSGSPPLELRFRNLLENWVPPPMQSECTDFDDQEWLFETNQNHNRGAKIFKDGSDGLSYGNSTPWPCVCYLPEAEIYALPFTVPF